MSNPWRGKSVAITGIAGTVGRELMHQLLSLEVGTIVGVDNNESELFYLREQHSNRPEIRLYVCDVRDRDSLAERFRGCDVLLSAAALKHVGLCELSPRDAVYTNIIGTQNVIDAATTAGLSRVVLTSSDKAVNPTNVMGTSKLMSERLMTAADATRHGAGPIFGSTRFGNVLGSRGSVVPLFTRQIAKGGPVTLTHAAMTRFIMTLEDAVRLLIDSTFRFNGGEVFITKMASIRIKDLAEVMIEELAPQYGHDAARVEIETIGTRPAEKMFEELMNDEEVGHTLESDAYFIILPALQPRRPAEMSYPGLAVRPAQKPYTSANDATMEREALRRYLRAHKLVGNAA